MTKTYGDKAPRVAELACFTGRRWPVKGRRLVQEFPYIEADVKYAIKEYACSVVDVLARRTSLAFLNVQAAEEALPIIVDIMSKELGWDKKTIKVIPVIITGLLSLSAFNRCKLKRQRGSC